MGRPRILDRALPDGRRRSIRRQARRTQPRRACRRRRQKSSLTPHLSVRGFYGTTARRITDDQGLGADIVLAMVQALRCSACGDAIGAYEPAVVIEQGL